MALYKYVEGRDDGLGVPNNVVLRCSCVDRCELEVEKIKGDHIQDEDRTMKLPDEYSFTFKSKARNENLNVFAALGTKLKKIWYIIRGKDYLYFDIIIEERAMEEFTQGLQDLIKS